MRLNTSKTDRSSTNYTIQTLFTRPPRRRRRAIAVVVFAGLVLALQMDTLLKSQSLWYDLAETGAIDDKFLTPPTTTIAAATATTRWTKKLWLLTCETRRDSGNLKGWMQSAVRFKNSKLNRNLAASREGQSYSTNSDRDIDNDVDEMIRIHNICSGGKTWEGDLVKVRALLDFLSNNVSDENSIVIFTDSVSRFNPYAFSVSEVLQAYDQARHGRPILVSGEASCSIGVRCNLDILDTLYPEATDEGSFCPQFLNSGQFMGTMPRIQNMLELMLKDRQEQMEQGVSINSDEHLLARFRANHLGQMEIDYEASVFRNLAVGKLDPNVKQKGGKTCGRAKIRRCGDAKIPYTGKVNPLSLSIEMDPVPGCTLSTTPFSLHESGVSELSLFSDLKRFDNKLNLALAQDPNAPVVGADPAGGAGTTDPRRKKKRKAVVVDILSIASNSRKSYYQTQQRTWANHSLVRNFMYVTEDLDDPTSACRKMSVDVAVQILAWCEDQYSGTEGSWLMRRYMAQMLPRKWYTDKDDPVAWLCAQRRFPLGLATIILGYGKEERNESLPDYLLVVDDDTYYNMDLFYDLVVSYRDSNDPFVGAGCLIDKQKGRRFADPSGFVYPFGGFGLTYSKGSLERFLKPIHMHALNKTGVDDDSLWERSTIATIQNDNLIYERESFHDGMSVAELMEAYVKKDPFQDFYNWTRGYCFHGDWLLAAMQQLYRLHSSLLMDALLDSLYIPALERLLSSGNCLNGAGNCSRSDLACHYQRPSDMEQLSIALDEFSTKEQALKNKDGR